MTGIVEITTQLMRVYSGLCLLAMPYVGRDSLMMMMCLTIDMYRCTVSRRSSWTLDQA